MHSNRSRKNSLLGPPSSIDGSMTLSSPWNLHNSSPDRFATLGRRQNWLAHFHTLQRETTILRTGPVTTESANAEIMPVSSSGLMSLNKSIDMYVGSSQHMKMANNYKNLLLSSTGSYNIRFQRSLHVHIIII